MKKAITATQGMGGVGKTTAAAQLIRDPEVSSAFERLLWVSVSQKPDVLQLLKVLHRQMTSRQMPADVRDELHAAQLLREAAIGVNLVMVLCNT